MPSHPALGHLLSSSNCPTASSATFGQEAAVQQQELEGPMHDLQLEEGN